MNNPATELRSWVATFFRFMTYVFPVIIFLILIVGGPRAALFLYFATEVLSVPAVAIMLLILLPLSLWPRARTISGNGIMIGASLLKLALWLWAVAVVYSQWGYVGYIAALSVFSAMPLAIIVLVIKKDFLNVLALIVFAFLFAGAHFAGFAIRSRAPEEPEVGTDIREV